ncbi:MAG TPA: TlpA disulfide reductase family protein [Bacteroidota bacterium]|nr:TlpA disulfide reductase family protein [Bacteroidota bacterium]
MKRTAIFLFSIALMMAASGCGKSNGAKTADNSTQTAKAGAANVSQVVSVEQRQDKKVPLFSWTDESGKKVTIDEFAQGGGVLVNFWATWCGPCKKEIPDLVELDKAYRTQGVRILGISIDRDGDVMSTVSNFVNASSIKYPVVIDNGELEKAFGGIRGIPTTFFVDKNGMITKRMIGLQSREAFAQAMDAVKP